MPSQSPAHRIAKIMAQPLYVSNLVVPAANAFGPVAKVKCQGGCNVVILATMKGTIYAYLADEKPQSVNDTLVWARYLSDGNACKCGATKAKPAAITPTHGIRTASDITKATNSFMSLETRNGFTPASHEKLFQRFRQLKTADCPFANLPESKGGRWGQGRTGAKMKECRWLKPRLVGQFELAEWTPENQLRHSRFVELREDKDPHEVRKEI
jgi:ATP dependent DNA ligase C terminal region